MGRMTYQALQPPFPEHKPEDQPARQAAVENELKFHTARLDVAAIQRLYDVHDTTEMREELRSALNVSEALDAQQREIVQDYYFHLYAFAKAKGFDAKKAGTLLSVCREVFETDAATNAPSDSVWKSTSESCCAAAVPVATSRRWHGTSTPSSRRSHGNAIASMAWGA